MIRKIAKDEKVNGRIPKRNRFRNGLSSSITVAIGALSVLVYAGCNYQVKKTGGDEIKVPKLSAKDIPSYNELKATILSKRCAGCHGPGDKFDSTNYPEFAARAGAIASRLVSTGKDRMPPADKQQLTQQELTVLLNWLSWGAPQEKPRDNEQRPTPNPTQPPPNPIPEPTATPSPTPTRFPRVGNLPSFEQLKSYVLNGKCLNCHDGSDDIVIDLHTYPLFTAKSEVIRNCITLPIDARGHMPKKRKDQLTDNELMTLLAWLDSGCPEHGQGNWLPPESRQPVPTPVPTSTPTTVTALPSFTQMKSLFLDKKCLDCHDGADEMSVDLRTYTLFVAKLATIRKRIVLPLNERGHMPKKSKTQLSDGELAILLAWIDAGAPETGKGDWKIPASTPENPPPR